MTTIGMPVFMNDLGATRIIDTIKLNRHNQKRNKKLQKNREKKYNIDWKKKKRMTIIIVREN